jgi:hypothetical protein
VGNLRHDSGTITGSCIRTHGTTVLKVSERIERHANDVVTGMPAGRCHERKTAGVLIEGRIKEPRSCRHS